MHPEVLLLKGGEKPTWMIQRGEAGYPRLSPGGLDDTGYQHPVPQRKARRAEV